MYCRALYDNRWFLSNINTFQNAWIISSVLLTLWILCFAGAVHPGHAAPLCIQSPWDDTLGPRNLWGPQALGQPRCWRAGQNLGSRSSKAFPRQVKIQIPFIGTVCKFQCCFFYWIKYIVDDLAKVFVPMIYMYLPEQFSWTMHLF